MSRQKIGEATLILALSTIAANILQVVKLAIVSAWFGASTGILDQYFVALTVPLAFQGILMGALQASFIPLYVAALQQSEPKQAQQMLSSTLGLGIAFFTAICVTLGVFARPLLSVLASGFSGDRLLQNIDLFRMLLVMLFFSGLADLISAFYNAHGRYAYPAAAPLLSIMVSVSYLLLFRSQGVNALVFGLIAGTVCQLVYLIAGCQRFGGFRLGISSGFLSRRYKDMYVMMVPVAAGLLLAHANLLIDQAIASRLQSGSVTVLNMAARLHDVVFKVFVMSVAGALLPFLSQYAANNDFAELTRTIRLGNRLAYLVLMPVLLLVAFLGPATISALFQRGKFTIHDTFGIADVWTVYSLGLFLSAWAIYHGRALNAMRDLHPLWLSAAVAIPVNIALSVSLSKTFGVVGVAAARSFVYLTYLVFYEIRLHRMFTAHRPQLSTAFLRQSFGAILCFLLVLLAVRHVLGTNLAVYHSPTSTQRLMAIAAAFGCTLSSLGAYWAAMRWLKMPESDYFMVFAQRILSRLSLARRPS